MDDSEIQALVKLDPKNYDPKQWAALAWARDWATFRGRLPDQDLVREFEAQYTESERRDILAVLTVMDFANRWNNTFTGQVLRLPGMKD